MIQSEQRKKWLKKNKYRLRDPQGNVKRSNRGITGNPNRKRLKQRKFWRNEGQSVANLRKTTDLQIQEAQRSPSRVTSKRTKSKHHTDELLRSKTITSKQLEKWHTWQTGNKHWNHSGALNTTEQRLQGRRSHVMAVFRSKNKSSAILQNTLGDLPSFLWSGTRKHG